jgi:gamma-glutamylcyclotransferase (GGCT)/AIG2-like uncharacterized protein YtfP
MNVFVYGTLKRGYNNYDVMQKSNAVFLGCETVNDFACVDSPLFPIAFEKRHHKIKGEVFSIDDSKLFLIDRVEGYPKDYKRTTISTQYGDAYIYYYSDEHVGKYARKYGYTEDWQQET